LGGLWVLSVALSVEQTVALAEADTAAMAMKATSASAAKPSNFKRFTGYLLAGRSLVLAGVAASLQQQRKGRP